MRLACVDPGSARSGFVLFDTEAEEVIRSGNPYNRELLIQLQAAEDFDAVIFERFESFGPGSSFGESCIVTCFWTGCLSGAFDGPQFFVKRSICKRHLCPNGRRIRDPEVRQACIDRWGGQAKAIGKKATGYGPLHGVKTSHQWAALALAVYWVEVIEPDILHGGPTSPLRARYRTAFC